jgi:hypothetical protein
MDLIISSLNGCRTDSLFIAMFALFAGLMFFLWGDVIFIYYVYIYSAINVCYYIDDIVCLFVYGYLNLPRFNLLPCNDRICNLIPV